MACWPLPVNPGGSGVIEGRLCPVWYRTGELGSGLGRTAICRQMRPVTTERRAAANNQTACLSVPRSLPASWAPPAGRKSPVEVIAEQAASREPDLAPIRHGRMLVSPFTFYRRAAAIMAADLAATPVWWSSPRHRASSTCTARAVVQLWSHERQQTIRRARRAPPS